MLILKTYNLKEERNEKDRNPVETDILVKISATTPTGSDNDMKG